MDEDNKLALKDLEIKIHDARRQVEKLLKLERTNQPLPMDELEALASDLVMALKYFYEIRNGADTVVEKIAGKGKSNVIDIFPREDK